MTLRAVVAPLVLAAIALSGCDPFVDDEVPAEATLDVDGTCSRGDLGEDGSAEYLTAYRVVAGELSELCLGDEDPALIAVWDQLATMAPPELRQDIAVVAMFTSNEDDEDETFAFVSTLDDAGEAFQMAFNVDAVKEDADELLVTIAHEFSHVFTGTNDQLDRIIAPEDCETFDNGEGCYREGAIMLAWIDTFWRDGHLDDFDTSQEPTVADGEERCAGDGGFLGTYAASSPEEDFAESFGAFVLRVEPASPEQAARLAWFEAWPTLAQVRDRADAAGFGPATNTFELCGLG